MKDYRARLDSEEEQPAQETPVATPPSYMSLAEEYGFSDEMEIGASTETSQTIEQEFQAYVTAPLLNKNVDILKFWEVG